MWLVLNSTIFKKLEKHSNTLKITTELKGESLVFSFIHCLSHNPIIITIEFQAQTLFLVYKSVNAIK